MKRSGFTMIELIFVIVILGILAAVAIPRLAATRDDARISKIEADAATALADMAARYTSQGNFTGDTLGDVTNVQFGTDANPTAITTPFPGATFVLTDGVNTCLSFVVGGATDGNVTVNPGAGGTPICDAVIDDTANLQKVHTFGGVGVVR